MAPATPLKLRCLTPAAASVCGQVRIPFGRGHRYVVRTETAFALFCAWLAAPLLCSAQQSGNVVLDSNEQIFCVLAARSAAGYDSGSGRSGAAGEEVRAFLSKQNLSVLPELGEFFAQHQVAKDPVADLGQYISLALLLGPPPEFHFSVPQTDLPPDAKALAGLVPLLKTFYYRTNLVNLWVRLQPRYQAEIERYSDAVRETIRLADAYLRFPGGAYLGRTLTIHLSLLGGSEQVHARIYGQNYYLVVTPSKEPRLAEIRHQYLHFLLDPMAVKYAPEIHQKAELRFVARQAPGLATDFKEDFPLLVTECLVRAVESRMERRPGEMAERSLGELTASGLILVPYFFAALADYEKQDASMSVVYKDMILGINPRQEEQRLAAVKFSPRPTDAPDRATPALSEEDHLLNQGDNLIAEGRYSEAKAVFQSLLEKINPRSERALFGMAVVASNTRKPDLAVDYFQKTLDAARDLRIVTWTHIYLGRIYDLKGKREEALAQYRAASVTAATYPDALRAVQAGFERPFGTKD